MIYIVSNTRAERGPLGSVIAALSEAKVVGYSSDEPPAQAMAYALGYFTAALHDATVVVLLGDRYETLAAALAATFLPQRPRLVHIHGGETTTGAFDDALRHSVTHLTEQSGGAHCVATKRAQRRVHRMLTNGDYECPRGLIPITGAPGLDGVAQNSAKRDRDLILVGFHSETMAQDLGVRTFDAILDALRLIDPDTKIIFSGANSDPGGATINKMMSDFSAKNINVSVQSDVPHDEYIMLMQRAKLVIGNSSAGVLEAPWVGVPSVNIGSRQNGREMADSVFCAAPDVDDILLCIDRALAWEGYDPQMRHGGQPIYRGGAAPKIAEIVRAMYSSVDAA